MLFNLCLMLVAFVDGCSSLVRNHTFDTEKDVNMTKREKLKAYFNDRNRLQAFLLSDYNRQIPGIFLGDRYGEDSQPLSCNVTLTYANLLSVEERKQSALMIIDLDWNDIRLTWNPSDFGGIQQIAMIKKDSIWIPDVLPIDILSYSEILPEDRQNIVINSEGILSMYSSTIVEFVCHVDLRNFPFDQQICSLYLTSNFFSINELVIDGKIDPLVYLYDPGNGEWEYVNMTVDNMDDLDQHNIQYKFAFMRTTVYYIMLIIIPSFILTVLCLTGLLWEQPNCDSYMETLSLGFAAIQAMMFVLQMTTQDIPRINQVDKLSMYSMINLGLITVASLIVMIMGKLSKVFKRKTNREVITRRHHPEQLKEGYSSKLFEGFLRYYHWIFLHIFVIAAVINLVILVT